MTTTGLTGTEYEFPLSAQQTRLWILEQLDPGNAAYHVPITLRIAGDLRVDVLFAALQHIVDRHEALRTRYEPTSRVQVVAETWALAPTLVEVAGPAELARVAREVQRRPFDLWSAPPLRAVLARLGPTEHVLLIVVHHIACDGWSIGVLARELSEAYSARLDGRPPRLPELAVQYGDFSVWQQDRLSGDPLRTELEHWSRVLDGAPSVLDLPTDHPRPARRSFDGARVKRLIDERLAERIERFAKDNSVSLYMVLLAAFATVLARLSDQDTVVVGTATAGRTRPEIENLVGCFIDVLPLRVDVSGDEPLGELLARVRRVCLEAYAHQELPFERLVEQLRPERDLARSPIFQVMLNLHDTPAAELRWPGLLVTGEQPEPGVAKYDLTVDVHRHGAGLTLDLEYNQDIVEQATVHRLAERLVAVLTWFCDSGPAALPSTMDILVPGEAAALLDAGSGPRVEPPATGPVGDTRVADILAAAGIGRGDVVGVLMPSAELAAPVIAGAWLAGATAVPLDPVLPLPRLGLLITDSATRAVLSCAELADRIPGSGIPVLLVDGVATGTVAGVRHGADPALILYPSTSAGRPAGLALPRRAVPDRPIEPTDVLRLSIVDGRPAPNTTVHVLDERLRRVPFGVAGELFVGGPVTSDGYHHGRPALTATRFVPFAGGQRLYRTGELGRLAADGTVSLAGKLTERVSIRGHRVHPAELEARLLADPSVLDAAVVVRDDRLVAYLVARPDTAVPDLALPRYLMPAIVMLDAIPRDAYGRFDHRAVPAPAGEPMARTPVEPRDTVEAMVLDCFRRVLGKPRLGVTDDFFDSGGSSVSATMLLAELEQTSGERLVLRELFRDTTAAAVAARLRTTQDDDFSCAPLHPKAWCPGHVLLTTAGGELGVALIDRLLADPGTEVSVLVDAADDRAADHLLRHLAGGYGVDLSWVGDRLHAVAGNPTVERFGLTEERYVAFSTDVAAVYHLQPAGLREVIRFAARTAGKAVHHVHGPTGDPACEELIYRAACAGVPVTDLRVWPVDLLTRCLTAVLRFGRLPDLPGTPLRVLPAGQAADAIVHIGRNAAEDGQVVTLADTQQVALSELTGALAELGRPVDLVAVDALSAEEISLLRPLLDGEPQTQALTARPLAGTELTVPRLRAVIAQLEKNETDQGVT